MAIIPGLPVTPSSLDDIDERIPATTVKTTSETRTSTTTLANDGELFGITLTPGIWEVDMLLAMIGGAGAIAIKTRWSFTGTWNVPVRYVTGPTAANTTGPNGAVSTQTALYAANVDAVYGLTSSAIWQGVREQSRWVEVTVTGLLSLQWAPNVSSATSGGLRQSSTVTVRKIS
ncbi:hypothetical protein Ait01nite_030000 [Actinoplanes italicus]|uniref:Uncharacterized protein n=1 Tax=Actinoplanes italicus TaxID=113567 RepID=A0A2T0KIW0_9ACTN|nr:hypothetical protein [Actinoplanes italicus]PRX23457.1 hypothetical protein CLV67_103205 [Actinoplanes italicus]GIE29955.1 hypothetical protein Ait01nite_030000 [Actinoplanes italicus]